MKNAAHIPHKIFALPQLLHVLTGWRLTGKKVAFTNGCFDILHEGHIFSLSQAANEADILIVGLNSDDSTKRLKGPTRPLNNQHSRALILASLLIVDAVVIFEEDTPLNLITTIKPDVIVKGGDYTVEQIAGAKEVMEYGGRVVINPILDGYSTTGLIEKIKASKQL
ncbi:D-glycero-beta-D-manno-heptose 1-phosphate adenylyltransferase [Foetidibacter luteolus]|uniref:D-glycero-beta-D-manno-heptose 1-phosphate adenylyltransferase n=1 Tax=Foetidibacter luteolus TaxID=2608880 RepID=UPI00129BFEC1|nr:D-glycero-beta-D-manno-heptose 1-phosphate adenylyltransferase [Foetidibacter luteolus]